MGTTTVHPQPLFRLPFPRTRNLLFGPDGQIVIGVPEGSWISLRLRDAAMRVLPVLGTHAAFLGRWLLVRADDRTQVLNWDTGEVQDECEIGFDRDAGFADGPAIVAAAATRSAFVRDGRLWTRTGGPDTINDRTGWEPCGEFSANVRLLCTADGRYIVGCNAGMRLDVFDTGSRERRQVQLHCEGHPVWMSLHPAEPVAAVGSRALEFVDLERGVSEKRMELRQKIVGEYLPDGTLLCGSERGVIAVRDGDLHVVLPEPTCEYQPVRVSPDGQVVVVAGEHLTGYRAADVLPAHAPPAATRLD